MHWTMPKTYAIPLLKHHNFSVHLKENICIRTVVQVNVTKLFSMHLQDVSLQKTPRSLQHMQTVQYSPKL